MPRGRPIKYTPEERRARHLAKARTRSPKAIKKKQERKALFKAKCLEKGIYLSEGDSNV